MLRSVPGDRPIQGDDHLEAMLAGQPLPDKAEMTPELRGVDELLAALRAAPLDPVEWPGQARALGVFRETFAKSHPSSQTRRRPAMLKTLLGAKLGASIAAAGALSLGSVGAAAYAGGLPDGLQDFAHKTVGAPAAHHGKAGVTKTHGVGPDAKGEAAFGLCNAWSNHQDKANQAKANPNKANPADKSVAFRNLATAAGGESKIAAYCAKVPHPAPDASDKAEKPEKPKTPGTHPSIKPSTHPSIKPSTHPSIKPSIPSGGKPSTLPSNGASGQHT